MANQPPIIGHTNHLGDVNTHWIERSKHSAVNFMALVVSIFTVIREQDHLSPNSSPTTRSDTTVSLTVFLEAMVAVSVALLATTITHPSADGMWGYD